MNTKIKNQKKKTNMKKKKPVEKISFGESREHSQMIEIKISLKKKKNAKYDRFNPRSSKVDSGITK